MRELVTDSFLMYRPRAEEVETPKLHGIQESLSKDEFEHRSADAKA